jgi:hypothetical protein
MEGERHVMGPRLRHRLDMVCIHEATLRILLVILDRLGKYTTVSQPVTSATVIESIRDSHFIQATLNIMSYLQTQQSVERHLYSN